MCHYISLVTSGIDSPEVCNVLRTYKRRAFPSNILSLQNAMTSNELQFFTCIGDCDCGTTLAHAEGEEQFDPSRQLQKYLAKGWSHKKAERALQAKQEATTRNNVQPIDSHEFWSDIISDLLAVKGCQEVGLMLHFYSGSTTTEAFDCRRKPVKLARLTEELASLPENTLLMFSA